MASIRSSITLTDGMSPVLNKISGALESVTNKFGKLDGAISKGPDASKFQRIGSEINRNTQSQNKFNNSLKQGASSANLLWSKLKAIAATYLTIQSVGGIIKLADQFTMTRARLQLVNETLGVTGDLQNKIYESAMRSRAAYFETADAVAKLGLRTGDVFKNLEEVIAFNETLNKMFVIAGTGEHERYSATLQLTQALGSGVLRGQEFIAVFEAAPNVMQAVAKYMNVPIGKLKDMAADGKVTAQIVKNAMFAMAEETNRKFAKMPYTWAQIWVLMKNYAIRNLEPVLKVISDIAKSERFKSFADSVGVAIERVAKFAAWVADVFITYWPFIEPIIWGIVAALSAAAIASFVTWVQATWGALMYQVALFKMAVAQYGFNAALAMCPITWFIYAIIAVIAVIYLAVAAINHFAGTSYSATGFIAGCFTMLGAVIWNTIAYAWNAWASFIEFFANFIKNPIYSVKRLFVNLATNALDSIIAMTKGWDNFATGFVNAIISAVNGAIRAWNKFIDLLPDSVSSALGLGKGTEIAHRTSITSDLTDAKSKLQGLLGDKPADYWEAPKMEYKGVKDAYMKGYNWGSNLSSNLSDNLSNKLAEGLPASGFGRKTDLGDALDGKYNTNPDLKDIVGNTDKIASNTDTIAANKEDLDFMRDLAEMEAINRYTLTDLKIDMTNNNHIGSKVDADDLMKRIAKEVSEGILATADGLHF